MVKRRVNAEGLMDHLNFLELLENVCFTDYEKKLIPLVLLQLFITQKSKERKEETEVELEIVDPQDRREEEIAENQGNYSKN